MNNEKQKYVFGGFELPFQIIHVEAFKHGKLQVIDAKSRPVKFFKSLTQAQNFIYKFNQ